MERSMRECESVKIWGGCGTTCPIYRNGYCKEPAEIVGGMTEEQKEFHKEMYGD